MGLGNQSRILADEMFKPEVTQLMTCVCREDDVSIRLG